MYDCKKIFPRLDQELSRTGSVVGNAHKWQDTQGWHLLLGSKQHKAHARLTMGLILEEVRQDEFDLVIW